MNSIGMPVYRPTPDCIWNSFRSSGKKHLILTGNPSAGKTTLLTRLFPSPPPGVTTWVEPGKAVFLRENTTGMTAQIGVFDPTLPGARNKMLPRTEGFLSLGIPALERALASNSPWVSIDEIGYLERSCTLYLKALAALMEKKHLAAAVRKEQLPYLQQLCPTEDLFVVDLDNPFGNMGCVIMASGLGKRFGANKLTAPFRGRPLMCGVLDATEGLFSRRVVVTRHQDVARLCESRGIPVLLHQLPHRSDTVRLGLTWVGDVEGCLFCPADQPLLSRESAAALLVSGVNLPDDIWRLRYADRPGSPVLFPKWVFPQLMTLPQGMGGGFVVKKYPERLRYVSARDEYELSDVDTPEDLERLVGR